jgi:hypothetical protein
LLSEVWAKLRQPKAQDAAATPAAGTVQAQPG